MVKYITSYTDLLKDPRWQKKRLEIFNRDNFKCQQCGRTDQTLAVHHIKYVGRYPWETPNKFLLTLCEPCHEYETELTEKVICSMLYNYGVTRRDIRAIFYGVAFRLHHNSKNKDEVINEICSLLVSDDQWKLLAQFIDELEDGQ